MIKKVITKILTHKAAAVIAVALVIAGGVYTMNTHFENKPLKVAFPSAKKASDYEPTKIALDYEYIFLENVFSPLLEMSERGHVESGVAEQAEWIGDELKLTIRKNLKTASGKSITPDDVVFSLKRLLILTGNTHGNFKDIVCPNAKLTTVDSNCEGIRSDESHVYLNAKGRKTFLSPMLTAIDFAIIPRASVDPVSLKIVNFKETSGIYYVESEDGEGNITLRINPNHYHYSDKIPQTVQLVPVDTKVKGLSLDLLKKGQVDHITTIDASRSDEVIKFYSENPDFDFHMTMKIRNLILVFTDRGQKEISTDERRYIGEKVKTAFLSIFKDQKGIEQRGEFFLSAGEGGLSSDQQIKLAQIIKNTKSQFNRPIKIGILKRGVLEEWSKPIQKELPTAECYTETRIPAFTKFDKPEDEPHVFIASIDTGFAEDISLISYALNGGVFGLTKKGREQWLSDYMSTDNKDERAKKLKDLHFQSLVEPVLVPLMASPYTALIRKPYKLELSDLFANNQLWRIKTQ